jgi:hypothetical protein
MTLITSPAFIAMIEDHAPSQWVQRQNNSVNQARTLPTSKFWAGAGSISTRSLDDYSRYIMTLHKHAG